MSDVTRILDRVHQGEAKAAEELLPLLYEELRKLAAHQMAHELPGHTLQPTALVHEAWLRLVCKPILQHWESRRHFFGAAAEAMRRILVENARRKQRLKHGGGLIRIDLDPMDLAGPMPDEDLLALDEALTRLAEVNPRAAEVVNLCFFAGLTQEQAAQSMGISVATVERTWAFARAWLFQEIRKDAGRTP